MKKTTRGLSAYQKVMNNKPSAPDTGKIVSIPQKAIPSTVKPLGAKNGFEKQTAKTSDNKLKKAAKLLMLLGQEQAADIVSHLSEEEIRKLAGYMAETNKITPAEAHKILSEFGDDFDKSRGVLKGGPESAKALLERALSPEKAKEILGRVLPDKNNSKNFDFLDEAAPHIALGILKSESEMTLGMVLPRCKPALAAKVIRSLEPEKQKAVVSRIVKASSIMPEVLARIRDGLFKKVQKAAVSDDSEVIDGQNALTAILSHMDYSAGSALVGELGESDPELAGKMREALFSFETLLDMRPGDMEIILREFADREIALLLFGQSEKVKEAFFAALSGRRRGFIEEETALIGPSDKKEAEKTKKDFLAYVREKVETEDIIIFKEKDKIIE